MSKRNWKILIEDILEAINKIEKYVKDMDFEDFAGDSMVVDAVVRNIEIIGEASNRIPDDIKLRLDNIPWKQLKGIRNRIVHEYFGIDISIIWEIVKHDLPDLKTSLIKSIDQN